MQPSQPGAPIVYSGRTEQSYQKKPQAIFPDKGRKEIEATGSDFYSALNCPWHFLQHFPHKTNNWIQHEILCVWGGTSLLKGAGISRLVADVVVWSCKRPQKKEHHFQWKISTSPVSPTRKSQHKVWALIRPSSPIMVQFSVLGKMLVLLRKTLNSLWKGPFLFSSLLLVRKIYTLQIIAVSLCWSYSGFVIQ